MLLAEKLFSVQASAATAYKVYIEDAFSAALYTGTGASQTITSGVDLSSAGDGTLMQGGLVWIKGRSGATGHRLFDTVRGATNGLDTSSTAASAVGSTELTAFSSSGFTLGADADVNTNTATYAAWSFRRAKGFFDVVTYTGSGTSNRQLSHSLGAAPGMVVTKITSTTGSWNTYHRSATGDLVLETTAAQTASQAIITAADASTFTVSGVANSNGATYAAYLFAHDTSTDGVIQCGSFTTDASGNATGTLGWEPGFLLYKRTGTAGTNWVSVDEARGFTADAGVQILNPNATTAEVAGTATVRRTATGFTFNGHSVSSTFIYMAIRRGPMRVPTDATNVFSVATGTGTTTTATPADMHLARFQRTTTANTWIADRLRGYGSTGSPLLKTNLTDAEATPTTAPSVYRTETDTTGPKVNLNLSTVSDTFVHYAFTRAPGFFDQVCYTGTSAARTVAHNLGQAPSMIWIKGRSNLLSWAIYHSALGATNLLSFSTAAASTGVSSWNSTEPTSGQFSLGSTGGVNSSGTTYVAYLFGDVPGVSKAGIYTGTGSPLTLDLGFSPRFIVFKRTDTTGGWMYFDTARGIVAASDPLLQINATSAELLSDYVDPVSGGIIANAASATINASGGTYVYFAIA